ncbi:RDD family protein [Pedobacter psychrodurus]|jgi:uncharacterized RDD family membrane protein YckC|uniref:RDD family protein n=1 Tax=Pedobacter psychrodurus TaxID=2530456 RepID=UPI0029305E02|nr:RDD family protein [Pedobacter psychrodurus]
MEEKYPSLVERLQSTFIDTIVIIILMVCFSNVLDGFNNVPEWVRILLFAFLFVIYEPLFMTFGCTIGNYVKGIRVRKNEDIHQKINIGQAILRYPIKLSLGWISFLTINSNLQRRAIHDLASGSVMIKL